jgi:NAD(P)-dependent dehydrogenase (short-subunit alcohol dehydrogenase family)
MTNYLITGANSDIGVACINKILDYGGSVIATHRNLGSKLSSLSLKNPSSVELYNLDFSDQNQVGRLLDLVEERKSQIDSFISLAALREEIKYHKTSRQDLMKHFEVNVVPAVFIVQKLGESMAKRGWGRIVIGSSIGVKFGGGASSFCYSFTKHCSEFIPNVANKWSESNVLYNVLRIGVTNTSTMQKFGESLKKRTKLIPMQRPARPEEVAKQIHWLASEENTFVTNQVISISGGE